MFRTLILISFFEIKIHCLGFISSFVGYLVGSIPSSGHDIALYLNAVNIMIALTGTVFDYSFNTQYLKRKHALIICHEIAPPQKNLISLKKLIVGALAFALLILALIGIQILVPPCSRQTTQPVLACYIVVGVQLFFSRNEIAWNHFKQVLRIKRDNLEFSSFNLRQMFGRGNKVSTVA